MGLVSCAGNDSSKPTEIFLYDADISEQKAEDLRVRAEKTIRLVSDYLGKPRPSELTIDINHYTRPHAIPHINKIKLSIKDLGDTRDALVHEIAHIFTPSQFRFLREGIAVHVEWKMRDQGLKAVPVGAKAGGPHKAFIHYATRYRAFPIDKSAEELFPAVYRMPKDQGGYAISYAAAGSFASYLVERFGIGEFMMFYDAGEECCLGDKSLSDHKAEWWKSLVQQIREEIPQIVETSPDHILLGGRTSAKIARELAVEHCKKHNLSAVGVSAPPGTRNYYFMCK